MLILLKLSRIDSSTGSGELDTTRLLFFPPAAVGTASDGVFSCGGALPTTGGALSGRGSSGGDAVSRRVGSVC